MVSYLGDLDEADRQAVQHAANGKTTSWQLRLFESSPPKFAGVDAASVAVENVRRFGGAWLLLQIIRKIGLKAKLDELPPVGREDVPWSITSPQNACDIDFTESLSLQSPESESPPLSSRNS